MFDPSKWSDEDWKLWRANNIKLLLEGWNLGTDYMNDGSINEYFDFLRTHSLED